MQVKERLGGLFKNTGFILALAFVIGLSLPQGAPKTSPAVTPALAVTITMAVLGISPRLFLNFKRVARPVLTTLLLNYVILAFILIGLATLFIPEYELWAGFVILAAVPPAIDIIPFTYHLKGDFEFSLIGTVGACIAALLIIPLISISFLGVSVIPPGRLLLILTEMIIAPLAIAQLLQRTGAAQKLEKYRGTVISWCFFLVVYTVVGLNQTAFFEEPLTLLRIAAIAFVSTFGLGYVVNRVAKRRGRSKPNRISLMMLSTRKIYGLAAAISLTFFSAKAALPAALTIIFAISHFIWLAFHTKRMA